MALFIILTCGAILFIWDCVAAEPSTAPGGADAMGIDWEDMGLDSDRDEGEGPDFADPGSGSALRAATDQNPRNLPCPTCGEDNRLTPEDRARGYQCNACADRAEGLRPEW